MTKENQKTEFARSVMWVLIALAFGAYLGSPVPKVWAEPVSRVMTVVSEQITQMERLHNNDTIVEEKSKVKEKSIDEESSKVEEKSTEEVTLSKNTTETGIEMIISEPRTEEQPDYICLGANRGGIADRKELDVLIHLINAEAYGLSYKAKVAVGQVVMNRWTGPCYGDDLLAIMTAPYQFTPIYNGSAYEKEIEPDSIKAANAVLSGAGVDELTSDTYYFVNPDFTEDKTIENEMAFVCEIEGLHFFKPPAR